MQTVITAKGKAFHAKWCGVSTIDRALRFGVTDTNIGVVTNTFLDPGETETIIHAFDDMRKEYHGFTRFKGVELEEDGTITVALMEERS